jgi:hypothetical protein
MHGRSLEVLTRLGFAARGFMYVVIGWLALREGRAEDAAGALEYLGSGAGRLLLAVMATGFLSYGLWRLANAWFDGDGHGSDAKGKAVRAGGAFSGIAHLGLFIYSARLALGDHDAHGSGDKAREGAATALTYPGGWTFVAVAAACLLGMGAFQLVKAARASFLKHLDGRATSAGWVRLAGRIGYAARGAVFLTMGWFLGRAAMRERASEAGGMDDAISSMPATLQLAVAFGLLLFGLFSLVEARHRRIADPARLVRENGLSGR